MKRFFLDFWRHDTGAAAVEYALLAPVFILILVGTVDFGMFIHNRMIVQDLARAATQYVVQGGDPADIMANVIQQSDLYNSSDADQSSITYDTQRVCECANGVSVSCTGTCPAGDYVRSFYDVTINAVYTPFLPYPGISDNLTFSGHSRMQY